MDDSTDRMGSCRAADHSTMGPGLDLGLEVSLALFEQVEHLLAKDAPFDSFFASIRNMTRTEALIAIESVGDEARVEFSHFNLEKDVIDQACSKEGVYSNLARIRFTHFYHIGSMELREMLPSGHPPIENLLAVPTQWQGETTGCLVVVNRIGDETFGQTDAMVLSLAAEIMSFVKEYQSLLGKLARF